MRLTFACHGRQLVNVLQLPREQQHLVRDRIAWTEGEACGMFASLDRHEGIVIAPESRQSLAPRPRRQAGLRRLLEHVAAGHQLRRIPGVGLRRRSGSISTAGRWTSILR